MDSQRLISPPAATLALRERTPHTQSFNQRLLLQGVYNEIKRFWDYPNRLGRTVVTVGYNLYRYLTQPDSLQQTVSFKRKMMGGTAVSIVVGAGTVLSMGCAIFLPRIVAFMIALSAGINFTKLSYYILKYNLQTNPIHQQATKKVLQKHAITTGASIVVLLGLSFLVSLGKTTTLLELSSVVITLGGCVASVTRMLRTHSIEIDYVQGSPIEIITEGPPSSPQSSDAYMRQQFSARSKPEQAAKMEKPTAKSKKRPSLSISIPRVQSQDGPELIKEIEDKIRTLLGELQKKVQTVPKHTFLVASDRYLNNARLLIHLQILLNKPSRTLEDFEELVNEMKAHRGTTDVEINALFNAAQAYLEQKPENPRRYTF